VKDPKRKYKDKMKIIVYFKYLFDRHIHLVSFF
jgi:hypothetical protein